MGGNACGAFTTGRFNQKDDQHFSDKNQFKLKRSATQTVTQRGKIAIGASIEPYHEGYNKRTLVVN